MSNVVQFLEALARNPKSLSADEFVIAVAGAELEPTLQQALLNRDTDALNKTIGSGRPMMCIIVPAENDEPQEGEEPDGEGESPESEISSLAA